MPNIRAELSKKNPFSLSKHAFYTAYHFALQYPELKSEYELLDGQPVGRRFDGQPRALKIEDKTADTARRRAVLSDKMKIIEDAAKVAGGELYPWLLRGVTQAGVSYNALRLKGGIPCGKNEYYRRRRLFYYLLDQKMK